MSGRRASWVVVGRIGAPHGVRGWVKLKSFTEPDDNIATYRPWRLRRGTEERDVEVGAVQRHGSGLVARLAGIGDRDAAAELRGMEILVERACFAAPDEGQYYWSDLLDLQVLTMDGRELGRVEELLATGANDVLVVVGDRRRLIPFLPGRVIRSVDLQAGRIVVDWDPDF